MNQKITLFEGIDPIAQQEFTEIGHNVISHQSAYSGSELQERIGNSTVIGIRSITKMTGDILRASDLEVLGCYCIGTNQVDLQVASEKGIVVFNDPVSNGRSVVELALGMMFSLARKLPEKNAQIHQGEWNKSAQGAVEMRGKTIGIIGYGNIGKQLGQACSSLGMNVVYYDINLQPYDSYGKLVSLDQLLETSDIVSVHVPGEGTHNMIGFEQIAKMKKSAYFMNLSRGHVVDQQVVADALEQGNLAGVGFDVYESEPKKNGPGFINPLLGLPNTILTPHLGGSTAEAQKAIAQYVTKKISGYLRTGNTVGSVNMPQIDLGEVSPFVRRFGMIHQDHQGMIQKIAHEFSSRGLNVEDMRNKGLSNETYAYSLIDIKSNTLSKGDSLNDILNSLNAIPGVILTKEFGL